MSVAAPTRVRRRPLVFGGSGQDVGRDRFRRQRTTSATAQTALLLPRRPFPGRLQIDAQYKTSKRLALSPPWGSGHASGARGAVAVDDKRVCGKTDDAELLLCD